MSATKAVPGRPLGITVSCWVLGLNAAAGFRGATTLRDKFLSVDPAALRAPARTVGALLSGVAIAYGITALAATIGLWHMQKWGPRAYVAWAFVACSWTAVGPALLRIPIDTALLLKMGGLDVVFVAIAFIWWRYIQRTYERVGAL